MLVFEGVVAVAVKLRVEPSSIEVLVEGARVILPGKRGDPGLPPPPQAMMVHRARIAIVAHAFLEPNPPIHPSEYVVSAPPFGDPAKGSAARVIQMIGKLVV